jgi:hypothetical protein
MVLSVLPNQLDTDTTLMKDGKDLKSKFQNEMYYTISK